MAKDDPDCLALHPPALPRPARRAAAPDRRAPAGAAAEDLYGVLPPDHRLPYDMEEVIFRLFDGGEYTEFQPEYAPEMLCANMRLAGRPVAVIANRRGFLRAEGRPRIGGIVYTESARKVAYFVETNERLGCPIVYLQDVCGFMVGQEAERGGIIRAGRGDGGSHGLRHGAEDRPDGQPRQRRGLLRHGGPGLRPALHFRLAHRAHRGDGGRIGGAGAVLRGARKAQSAEQPVPEELKAGHRKPPAPTTSAGSTPATPPPAATCDAIIDPMETRDMLTFALEVDPAARSHRVLETLLRPRLGPRPS